MARDYYINGEVLVRVKGKVGSSIATIQQLGLTDRDGIVQITPQYIHEDIPVDAWGDAPPEIQFFLGTMNVSMTLVHFDQAILEECLRLSQAGPTTAGTLPRAGTRMGGGASRFAAGNNYIGLNLTAPANAQPWRFFFSYLTGPPVVWPLGTRRSHVRLNWRVIPYTTDPYQDGSFAASTNVVLWDRNADT